MKSIIKTSKRGIIVILVLCMLLEITATCVNAATILEETSVSAESTVVIIKGTTTETEENTIVTEKTSQELMPTMARACWYDDYYIEGEPDLPVGAMPEGSPTIGGYVSASFLDFVLSIGYPDTDWYYYMQDYRLPNGKLVKYHIWANDELDLMFHHRR